MLDETIEFIRDPDDKYKQTEETWQLGLVCHSKLLPWDGMEAIPNPFIQ